MMTAVLSIAARELLSLFLSPMAWTVLAVLQLILSYLFIIQVEKFASLQPRLLALEQAPGLTEAIVPALYGNAGIIFLLVTPLLTMRCICEERRTKTLPLLLSAPVSLTDIVLGKFFGVFGLLLLVVVLLTLMPLSLLAGGSLDFGKLFANVLALSLLAAAFTSAGLYMSCVSPHPAAAALSAFGVLMLLWLLDWSATLSDLPNGFLSQLSILRHFQNIQSGLLSTSDICYFIAFCFGFLLLGIRHLSAERLPG